METNNPKKAKLTTLDDEFGKVREWLMQCPHVNAEHPAVQAALKGLDEEIKRRERDAKLQKKFAADHKELRQSIVPVTGGHNTIAPKIVTNTFEEPDNMTDDWHDVTEETATSASDSAILVDGGSMLVEDEVATPLGKRLVKEAISAIAAYGVLVETPLAAIALVFHAAMCSESLGFVCTGIPENSSSTGFAAPIRDLPKEQYLPNGWDDKIDSLRLRYRKSATGLIILNVDARHESSMDSTAECPTLVEVVVLPKQSIEPANEPLSFSLSDHLNLESWSRAKKEGRKIAPALHYKSLSALLSKFCSHFDLGLVEEGVSLETADASQKIPYVDTSIKNLPVYKESKHLMDPPQRSSGATDPMRWEREGPTIFNAFPGLNVRYPHGDFDGDLLPGGLFPGDSRGNLMGPNHPAFQGGGVSGVGSGSGFGMRPRFDPFGPPGGPTDPDSIPPGGRRPGGPGDPNPDHLRPPNNLSNHSMFM